nr:hypothetical protein [Tanacetum cinerariifolium]
MKYQALKRKPLTEAQARRNMINNLKNMAGYKMDYFKGMSYNEIRPLFEKHYNYNQAFLNEANEGIKVLEKEVKQEKEVEVESSKREGESLEQEIAKKQKMEQETEELKKRLQIVLGDDDDLYADATPLASKIPIIDYKIHTERNKPYFKIIRADEKHMLFKSFSTMMKNFDRKDLESLWKIIRERFEKTEPKNYTDDYLLNTLKIMFEKPNVEANTHFTLEQIVNDVRLEVDDESQMSLELLRLVRRQLNEGVGRCCNIMQWNFYYHSIELTNLSPNSCILSGVLFLVSWNLAWSTYAKAIRAMQESFKYHRPIFIVLLSSERVEMLRLEVILMMLELLKLMLMLILLDEVSAAGNFMPPKPDLSYTSLAEFVVKHVVKNKSSEEETRAVRKNVDAPIVKEWVLDNEEEDVPQPNIFKKVVRPSIVKKEFVKPRQQEKTARKTVKKVKHNRQNTHRPRGNQRK